MSNRIIKFRIWNGHSMEYKVMSGYLGNFYVDGMSTTDSACLSNGNTIYHEIAPLMQFTGLLDKNGKEIWEGDIVKCWKQPMEYIGVCEYTNGFFGLNINQLSNVHFQSDDTYEVIGNIYENTDYMKTELELQTEKEQPIKNTKKVLFDHFTKPNTEDFNIFSEEFDEPTTYVLQSISTNIKKYFELFVRNDNDEFNIGYFQFHNYYGSVQVHLSAFEKKYQIFQYDEENGDSYYKSGLWNVQFNSILEKFKQDVASEYIRVAVEKTKNDVELGKFFSNLFKS